jgi:Kef-type K+ transport system membrane component KefB
MLFAGIELQPRQLVESSRGAMLVALGGFVLPLALGLGLAWVFLPPSELKLAQCLFVGTALAITAVPVAIRILIDLGQLDSPTGRMIVSAALVDDVLSLVLLAVLLGVIRTGEVPGLWALAWIGLKVGLFFGITSLVGMFVVPRIAHLIGRAKVAEFELSALLVAALAYAWLAEVLGLHFILGAFVAGLFFSRTTIDETIFEGIKGKVSGITSGFLAPIFFASIGLHLELEALYEIPLFLGLLIAVAFAGKLLGAGLVARLLGSSRREATAVGMAMSGRGAVELIIADIALRGGVFSAPDPPPPVVADLFSAVVIVAVVTTLVTPIALRRVLGRE